MQTPDAAQIFATLPDKMTAEEYNYEHFRITHGLRDAQRTVTDAGIQPGEVAPDFTLPDTEGGTVRLSDLRGKPVLLHFGSYT